MQKLLIFFHRDIWRIPGNQIRGIRGFGIRSLRIMIISIKEFASDKCGLRASALTFYSLLSIVPVFALAFGMAKGFGMDKMLKEKMLENTEGQQEVFSRIIEFSENLLQNTKGGVVAGIGMLFLFWTVIKVLTNIEISFNDIWGVKKLRTWGRRFTDYLSLMLIAPIVFIMGSSLTVFVISQISMITERISFLGPVAPLILATLKILPYCVFWGLLTFVYMFMPNTKIRFRSALIGGIAAGTAYQIVQWGYIHFQIGAAKAGAIYGSFAALPLFLIWLQISWLVVLYGAELAFAHQNEQTFEYEPDCLSASLSFQNLLSLRIVQLCVRQFTSGGNPLSGAQISAELETPIRLTRDLLFRLENAGILSTTYSDDDDKVPLYQPAQDTEKMSIQYVLEKLEDAGSNDIPTAETAELKALRQSLETFRETLRTSPANQRLKCSLK